MGCCLNGYSDDDLVGNRGCTHSGYGTITVGGFMLASAVLSMWISNSATTIMLTPIAVSVAYAILGDSAHRAPFTIAILLGLAYGASIGGIATPVGTPTNLIVIGYLETQLGVSISFADWMAIGVPVVVLMLPACWLTVTRLAMRIKVVDAAHGQDTIRQELACLGPMSRPERRVLIVFSFIALAWILRQPLTTFEIGRFQPFAGLTDHVIAVLLPVIGALATTGNADPVLLSMPVALAASCAFMFPIATGPNAIAFATNEVSILQMARTGLLLNLFGIVLISGVIYLLAPYVAGSQ